MLKINLSDDDAKRRERESQPFPPPDEVSDDELSVLVGSAAAEEVSTHEEDTLAERIPDEPHRAAANPEEPVDHSERRSGGTNRKPLFSLMGLILIFALLAWTVWLQRDTIMPYLAQLIRTEKPAPPPVTPVPPVQPAESAPAPETAVDPALTMLRAIGGSVPPLVWLTMAGVSSEGAYELQGIAFTTGAIDSFATALAVAGDVTVTGRSRKGASFGFAIAGNVKEIEKPELLDPLPGDVLAALADTLRAHADEFGVRFTRLPVPGETYTEQDLPFVLSGSYGGLEQVIAAVSKDGGKYRVNRLVVRPARGLGFDRVTAAFSLRTESAI